MQCRLCESEAVDPKFLPAFDLCRQCAQRLGVAPMPEPQRPARPCNRCNGLRFKRVVPRELSAGAGGEAIAAPMALTLVPMITRAFGGVHVLAPDPGHSRGQLETYVCTSCGFVEWYCIDPDAIPLGPEYMADVVDYTADAPYR